MPYSRFFFHNFARYALGSKDVDRMVWICKASFKVRYDWWLTLEGVCWVPLRAANPRDDWRSDALLEGVIQVWILRKEAGWIVCLFPVFLDPTSPLKAEVAARYLQKLNWVTCLYHSVCATNWAVIIGFSSYYLILFCSYPNKLHSALPLSFSYRPVILLFCNQQLCAFKVVDC